MHLMIKAAMPARDRTRRRKSAAKGKKIPAALSAADFAIEDKLRAWRLSEAKRRGVPAFRILTDQTLHTLASQRPSSAKELLAISGIGMGTVEKYATQIYRILREERR